MESPKLTVDAMLHAARQEAGLSDFGDDAFLEPFERLVASLHAEANLNAAGVFALHAMYTRLLINRLYFQDDLKRHPEILDEQLLPPILVIGMPRSGTTKLHRVLASDQGLRPLLLWQLINPAPFRNASDAPIDPRIAFADAMFAEMAKHYPDIFAGHPMSATDPDEETSYLMEMTFEGPLVPVRAYTPSFTAWRWTRSMKQSYRYLRKLFQYLQWQDRMAGGTVRPFLLKSPLHLAHITEFTQEFEGATIVHCHRDPVDCVPSFARLLEVGWAMMSDDLDLERCGAQSITLLKDHIDRYLPQRAALESHVAFIDAPFRQIVADAPSILTDVYARHGLNVSGNIQDRIAEWEAHNAADRFGKHTYSLERYGLTQAQLKDEFSDYYERFSESL